MRRILALLLLFALDMAASAGGVTTETVKLDSYDSSNQDNLFIISEVHPSATTGDSALAQSFQFTGSHRITSIQFFLRKTNSPVGELVAQVYSADVQTIASAKPATLLAESNSVSMSLLPLSPLPGQIFSFTFDTGSQPALSGGTVYAVAIIAKSATTLDTTNAVQVGNDNTSASHAGRCSSFDSAGWTLCISSSDLIFTVWGEQVDVGVSGGAGAGADGDSLPDSGALPTGPLAGGTSAILVLGGLAAVVFLGRKGRRR